MISRRNTCRTARAEWSYSASGAAALSDEDQRKAGLTPELVRLSIGLEHVDDIIAALDEALKLI